MKTFTTIAIGLLTAAAAIAQDTPEKTPATTPPPAAAEAAPPTGGVAPSPDADELAGIRALLDNENAVVDAVRQFQQTQHGLAHWDEQIAMEMLHAITKLKQADTSKEEADAQAKFDEAARRKQVVRDAWAMVYEKYPENPRVMAYYGEILYYELDQKAQAIELWKKSAAVDPKLPDPVNELMIHYFHEGDYENGWAMLDRVQKLAPDDPNIMFNTAQIYFTYHDQLVKRRKWSPKKAYKEAMKLSKRASEMMPGDYQLLEDYATNYYVAENFGVDADWREAADAWKKARECAPTQQRVFFTWLNEARTSIRAGDKSRAATALEEALKIDPTSDAAQNLQRNLDSQIAKYSGKKS